VNRAFVYLSALVGVGGMVYLAGTTQAQAPGAPGAAQPAPQARPTIAVFNMAAVMRDYGKAKYSAYQLNQKRVAQSGDLAKWRNDYIETQKLIQQTPDQKMKDELGKKLVDLTRKIEDKDRELNKMMNDDLNTVISQLYDDIKTVVDKTAEMNGYHVVFAYPDAVTPEEMKSPVVKEMKLRPPAAQPFFVARHVDITGVVVETLNKWYPAPPVPADANQPPPGTGAAPVPGGNPIPGGAPVPGGNPVPGGVPGKQ
jgi:Skp family chaperone for outer membrane proteins